MASAPSRKRPCLDVIFQFRMPRPDRIKTHHISQARTSVRPHGSLCFQCVHHNPLRLCRITVQNRRLRLDQLIHHTSTLRGQQTMEIFRRNQIRNPAHRRNFCERFRFPEKIHGTGLITVLGKCFDAGVRGLREGNAEDVKCEVVVCDLCDFDLEGFDAAVGHGGGFHVGSVGEVPYWAFFPVLLQFQP